MSGTIPSSSAARLDLRFDAERLQEAIRSIPAAAWVSHFNADYYVGDWSAAALRAPAGRQDTILPSPGSEEASHDDTRLCVGYLAEVLAAFPCALASARLMRLGPGACIREHHDPDIGVAHGLVRLHVPVTTNPEVDFRLDGERVVMRPGECWYLDFGLPHAVTNAGSTDRVHLVIDCLADDGLRHLLRAAGVVLPDAEPLLDGRAEDRALVIAELRRLGTPAALEEARRLQALD